MHRYPQAFRATAAPLDAGSRLGAQDGEYAWKSERLPWIAADICNGSATRFAGRVQALVTGPEPSVRIFDGLETNTLLYTLSLRFFG